MLFFPLNWIPLPNLQTEAPEDTLDYFQRGWQCFIGNNPDGDLSATNAVEMVSKLYNTIKLLFSRSCQIDLAAKIFVVTPAGAVAASVVIYSSNLIVVLRVDRHVCAERLSESWRFRSDMVPRVLGVQLVLQRSVLMAHEADECDMGSNCDCALPGSIAHCD